MIETQQEQTQITEQSVGKLKLNIAPNQCDYCNNTPCVLYVFSANDNNNIEEFQLCLSCRNFILLRMKVLIENKRAQRKENELRKLRHLTKGVRRSDER